MRTILYVFAGREPNLRIALPFYRRLIDENPDLTVEVWDLCRSPEDRKYLRSLDQDDRFRVRTEFSRLPTSQGQTMVWREYSKPDYEGVTYVKCDDDNLFYETGDAFKSFVQAAQDNPDKITSAAVINNGSATHLFPEIWAGFGQLGIPLLDVHMSAEYAELSHRWFAENWRTVIGSEHVLVPAPSWCSINCISFSWEMGRNIAGLIGTRSPRMIFDREFPRRNARGRLVGARVGDEGACNLMPIVIDSGYKAAHFSFGPQLMSSSTQDELRKLYASIAQRYLAAETPAVA